MKDNKPLYLSTPEAPAAIGAYAQAVKASGMLFLSGQLGINPKTGLLDGTTAAEQARRAMENIGAILTSACAEYENIVKATIFLSDISDFSEVNEVYASFFSEGCYPARTACQVANLPKGGLVEIEVIAACQ